MQCDLKGVVVINTLRMQKMHGKVTLDLEKTYT